MDKTSDLHIHSHYSEDGDFSVGRIFELAAEQGLSGISITDHDSVESVGDALAVAQESVVEYIPGVELTTVLSVDGSQQHILGYFVDHTDRGFLDLLKYIQDCRLTVARKRINALKSIGFTVEENRIWEMAGNRAPAAASIMLEVLDNPVNHGDRRLAEYLRGPKSDDRLRHFYREYLIEGAPAYVPFESVDTQEGIDAIKKGGGIPVLAHPVFVRNRDWLDVIVGYGIKGIEAISTYHTEEETLFYLSYAKKRALLITAGSDYHGPTAKPKVTIGGVEGNSFAYFEALKAAAKKNH